eukprot:GFUD01006686.1.p1 GENE.GFUD01006686.1~~GFUD01006686.1.p1  ORF type:complete len:407 (+),score=111.35 GFUD01006686.1:120-1340(+)
MVKLTEDMIVARTRVSDMNHVKKLNCWGAELSDITVLRKLTNVEVLSLSVNTINTLSDIQNCKNLQELYIRKNQIPDISEICWIKDLPRLKNLWLEENPCAEGDQELYRQTVIRNIPQLQKLDNVAVTSEEMADAMRRGIDLDHPLDGGSDNQSARLKVQVQRQEPQEDNRRMSRNSGHEQQEYEQPQRRESIQSPSRRVSNQVWPEEREATHTQPGQQRYEPAPVNSGTHWDEDGYGDAQTEYSRTYSSNYETGSYSRQREVTPDEGMRRHSVREESRYQTSQQQQQRPQRSSYSGPPSSDGYYRGQEVARPVQEYSSQQGHYNAQAIVDHHYEATYRQVDQQLEGAHQLVAQRALSPQRPYPIRPKNRNSNVLSAILCLIKEIDGPSLEVVEMAVRCRMEELED